ncbi:MAG TPA: hypothetical protein VE777_01675 [Gaiellales bacterium]|nr:hypothetical protein [Gaiellales bacterium]
MLRRDERDAARRLARVLDGAETGDAELEAVARLLRDAAAAARFEVSPPEVEHALGTAHGRAPAPRPGRPGRRGFALGLGVAVALAAAVLLLLPFGSGPVTVDVQARALSALGGSGNILRIVEVVRPGPGGDFLPSVRTGWIDPAHGLERWTQSVNGRVVAETLVDRGRVTRYDPGAHTATVAASCKALASGCAEATDPIAFYRRALASRRSVAAREVTVAGRRLFRFHLPVQRLPDAVRIEQVVSIDAETYLPVRIAWREQVPGGRSRIAAEIDVRQITVLRPEDVSPDTFGLEIPPGTHITQLAASGAPVRLVGARRITLSDARALHPSPLWLGRRYHSVRLTSITLLEYTGGVAVRLRYGPFTVWNYGPAVPPPLLGATLPVKAVPLGHRFARFYASRRGELVGEIDRPGGTAAVVAPQYTKEDVFAAVASLHPLA